MKKKKRKIEPCDPPIGPKRRRISISPKLTAKEKKLEKVKKKKNTIENRNTF